MQVEQTGGYISQIMFNNGEQLNITKSDIVVFVGPNNVGKSQALKDIYSLAKVNGKTTVVSNIAITKYPGLLKPLLDDVSVGNKADYRIDYNVLGHPIHYTKHSEDEFKNQPAYGDYRELFIADLNTENRLRICQPPKSVNHTEPRTHPIHYAVQDSSYRKWLSSSFKKAFGKSLIPNTQFGATVPLCMGDPVELKEKYADSQDYLDAYAAVLDTYKQVQEQGDGIKSFTGILLYLMLEHYCTFLIDEPEAFLHPPQARIMGEIIGEALKDNQQAFISTHSENILQGLLETCPERIKIVRITRTEDTNYFSILDNSMFNEVWNDPLLRYSNIMSSLFHKSVVLCESDADCRMYSVIESHIKQKDGKYSETLFIHCNGKHRMAKIASALRSLNVDVKLIPDIDVLNDQNIFRPIIETFGVEWESIKKDYNIVIMNLNSSTKRIERNAAKAAILKILDGSQAQNLSSKEIDRIKNAVKNISKWDSIKKSGKNAIPAGDASGAYGKLENMLREHEIYIVPAGELESFIREVGNHGPGWVNTVLEQYPNLDDPVYNQITSFISSLNL